VDIWFWVVVVLAAVVVAFVLVGARGARARVDPTQVTIDAELAAQLKALYAKGDKLQAVKDLRAATGLGLADAVRIVDKLGAKAAPAGGSAPATGRAITANIGPDHQAEIRSLVAAGDKIEAIKRVRQLTGMGLKEAKDYVDQLDG
jgi:ribosomal protein L7/L12